MVVISAYFSGSETGMMTLNRYRLRHRAKQGNRAARRVEKLLRKPDRLISPVLIGNNLVNILASALGTIVGMRLYGNAGVAIATGVLTFVVLVFAEVLPKPSPRFTRKRWPTRAAAGAAADPDDAAGLAAEHGHARFDADGGDQSRRHYQQRAQQRRAAHHRERIPLADLPAQSGYAPVGAGFGKVSVNDIMVPRNEIVGIDINDDWKAIVRQLTHSPHGRIVLYRDSLDDAISMLRVREAYRLMTEKKSSPKR